MSSKSKKERTFIDLFAGCGGLSLGLMAAGWNGVFAIEKNPDAFSTLDHNLIKGDSKYRFRWPSWLPKEPLSIEKLVRDKSYKKNLEQLRGKIELVVGGPPCQGFSMAGRRNEDDPRNKLVNFYIKFVDIVRPKYILIENVEGITRCHSRVIKDGIKHKSLKNKAYSTIIAEKLEAKGYSVFQDTLRSIDYGVPQNRRRHIFIGIRREYEGQEIADPFDMKDSARKSFLNRKSLPDRPITVGEAIEDLETYGTARMECEDSPGFSQIVYRARSPKKAEYWTQIIRRKSNGRKLNGIAPNSLRLTNHRVPTIKKFEKIIASCEKNDRKGISLSEKVRKDFNIKKHSICVLNKHLPSPTLTTLPDDFLHYSEPRILTVRECARLQSFPDWYDFKGKYTTGGKRRVQEVPRYTQVGNAVPPLLGEFLGTLIERNET